MNRLPTSWIIPPPYPNPLPAKKKAKPKSTLTKQAADPPPARLSKSQKSP